MHKLIKKKKKKLRNPAAWSYFFLTMTNLSLNSMLYTTKIVAKVFPEKSVFKILRVFYKKHPQSPRGSLGKNAKTIP